MKFTFYNDTGKSINIHPATFIHGVISDDKTDIKHGTIRVFTLPPGSTPWVKMWKNEILVSIQIDMEDDE